MLLHQNDVAVDEELEVIITIDSSTETDFGDYASGYQYSFGESTESSMETEACLHIGWMLKFSWNYFVLNEIRWKLIKPYRI